MTHRAINPRRALAAGASFLAAIIVAGAASGAGPTTIGAEARLPDNARSHYSRFVNWRPADGETVDLNPPRFSWPYTPESPKTWSLAQHRFRLQISAQAGGEKPVVDVDTAFNFYNALPLLEGSKRWYWRVGYDVGTPQQVWSDWRSFDLADRAQDWDRTSLARPELAGLGHPRVLFNRDNLAAIRELAQTNPASRAALEWMTREAGRAMETSWWRDFPRTDRAAEPEYPFYAIAHQLALVAFVWRMTGDDRYAGVKERAVTWASYPPGGRSSPEGLGGDGSEDATQGNEFLALLFDWLYEDLNEQERQTMIDSLTWRVDHIMNRFAWRTAGRGGPMLRLTFGPNEQVDRDRGGDQRLPLAASDDWQSFHWEVDVPAGATEVAVEGFNYYAAGRVEWDSIQLRPLPQGKPLVENPDFSDHSLPADGRQDPPRPGAWSPNSFGTEAVPVFDPLGGRNGSGAVQIYCKDAEQRGAWGQTVKLAQAQRLAVDGWYRARMETSGAPVMASSLSGRISSHQYEASMDTAVCGLVLYEHAAVGRQWYELMANYLVGITCGHGFDECWNEGPGYGTSKCKWLTHASLYFDTTVSNAHLGRNPFYSRLGEYFRRVIPVGMDHNAWGNQSNASRGNHLAMFRKLAHLTGDGQFLYNYRQYGGEAFSKASRPWIEYVLPYYYREPKPVAEASGIGLFPIDGWAMAATGPPSDPATYGEGVGFVFQARPRGGYGHSFNSDGSFQLHAYGQMLNHGGGSSANLDAFAYHTMSHHSVLVDGIGQAQPEAGQLLPQYARIIAFAQRPLPGAASAGERTDNALAGKVVYAAADLTGCYPRTPGDYQRWGLPIGKVYTERAAEHLLRFIRHIMLVDGRYFVVYDDLAASRPARFTWLYHIRPDDPLRVNGRLGQIDYRVGDVAVRLQHICRPEELAIDDRQGLDGMTNPFTGEDYRAQRKGDLVVGHNLWITPQAPAREWQFLSVVYPARPGTELPAISRLDDHTARVGDDVISFDPAAAHAPEATVVVDPAVFRNR